MLWLRVKFVKLVSLDLGLSLVSLMIVPVVVFLVVVLVVLLVAALNFVLISWLPVVGVVA